MKKQIILTMSFFFLLCMLASCESPMPEVLLDLSQVKVESLVIESGGKTYIVPTVSGLASAEIEDRANRTLREEFLYKKDGEVIFGYVLSETLQPETRILFLSQDFINVEVQTTVKNKTRYLHYQAYCTINTKTGELVLLDDIVMVSNGFREFLEAGNYPYPYGSIDNTDEIIDGAILSNQEYLSYKLKGDSSITQFELNGKKSIHFTEGTLWIKYAEVYSGTDIKLPIESIREFLVNKDADYNNYVADMGYEPG